MTQQRVSPITVTSVLPAVPVLSLQAALGQSANLLEWKNSSGTVLGSITSAGLASVPNLTVTSTTIPANGVYLPAANTLGFATNSAVRMQINSTGEIGIGSSASVGTNLNIVKSNVYALALSQNATGAVTTYGILNQAQVQSDSTGSHRAFQSSIGTQATSFVVDYIVGFRAAQGTFGTGSTVNKQYGFWAASSMTGATNNYGFYTDLVAASGVWGYYGSGTAANYFAGQTTVGSTSLTLGSSSAAQQFGVVPTAATNVGIVVRGAASQTGNLQEWQDSAGTIVASITSAGTGRFPQIAATTSGKAFMNTAGTSNALQINTNATTNIGLIVQGVASQTANLQEWQESGGQIRAYIMPGGYLRVRTSDTSSASIVVGPASTSQVPLIVEGIASQTGNLQNWRNSSGTILAKVDATGNFVVGDMAIATSSVATIHISNGTIPSANPTGGGVLYVEGGALKYRGSSGTITTVANA